MTKEQGEVNRRHSQDIDNVRTFIQQNFPQELRYEPVDNSSSVAYAISTTLCSSVLVFSVGVQSVFTRNTYSENPLNPWLVHEDFKENRVLANFITEKWTAMHVPNGQRERVDTIAKHIVYELKNGQFVERELTCDDNGNVRVQVSDLEIWSHPRRKEPLVAVLEEKFGEDFKRQRSRVKGLPTAIDKISNNGKIPDEVKKQRLREKRKTLKEEFEKFYEYYRQLENENCIPTSYQYATLQLAVLCNDRYGDTFAGVYPPTDNKVHMKFPADSAVQPFPLPTEEEVFNELMEGTSGLQYKDLSLDQ